MATEVTVTQGTNRFLDIAVSPADAVVGTFDFTFSTPGVVNVIPMGSNLRFGLSYVADGTTTLAITDPRSGHGDTITITAVTPPPVEPLAETVTVTVEP